MAKIKRPIGEIASGKVGNVVFFRHHEEGFVKAAPQRETNSWSADQQLHRQRISAGARLWRDVKSAQVADIWNLGSPQMNGYALFLKANLPALALDGSLMDPVLLQLSTGKLPLPLKLQAGRLTAESTTIAVSWENDPLLKGKRLQDELMVVSSSGGLFSIQTTTGLLRTDQQGSFELPAFPMSQAAYPTHFYLFFASADKTGYSASVCFTAGPY